MPHDFDHKQIVSKWVCKYEGMKQWLCSIWAEITVEKCDKCLPLFKNLHLNNIYHVYELQFQSALTE